MTTSIGQSNDVQPLPTVYVIAALVSGGAERQLLLLLRHLDRERFAPHLVAYAGGRWRGRFESLGVPVKIIEAPRVRAVAQTYLYLRKVRPGLVHTFGHSANYLGRLAAIAARVPVVISERSTPTIKSGKVLALDRLLGPLTAHLIANSEHAARFYLDRGLLPARKVSVIRNGVESQRSIIPSCARSTPLVVTLTDFRQEKNHQPLLRAAAHLRTQLPDVQVHFFGDGTGRAGAEADAKALGVAGTVVFDGYVDDVTAALAQASVYVHPSRYEGLPNGVLEAMAAGLPCVTFDAPGCLELVRHGKTGLVAPMNDDVTLSRNIARLLTNPDAARAMGDAGRSFVVQELSVAAMIEATIGVYERILQVAPTAFPADGQGE